MEIPPFPLVTNPSCNPVFDSGHVTQDPLQMIDRLTPLPTRVSYFRCLFFRKNPQYTFSTP